MCSRARRAREPQSRRGAAARAALRRARARASGQAIGRGGSRRRSTRRCSGRSQGIIAAHRPSARAITTRPTSPSPCSTTAPANGWRGKDRATTSTRRTAARSTASSSPRQPGSALKPFTYAAAFERGIEPGARAGRRAVAVSDGASRACSTARATTTASFAVRCSRARRSPDPRTSRRSRSRPTSACRRVARLLRQAGLSTLDHNAAHYGLGLTLGNAEVRLDELVAAYAMFARGGECAAAAHRFARSTDARRRRARRCALLSARTAFWITDILVGRRGARVHLRPRRQSRVSVHGRGQDRHVAGVPRQLGDRLHARRHRRRVGRQLRSHRRCAARRA